MPRRKAPWAAWYPIPNLPGGPITGKARKITYHTTQGTSLPNWEVIKSVPHLTVNPSTGAAWQHLDFDRSAYTLGSPGFPTSPNMNAGINIQIEIIGDARYTFDQTEAWYKTLSSWTDWLCEEWKIPKNFPFDFGGVDGYGQNGSYRVSWEAYRDASGIVGHSNVPFNTHWDPGNLNQQRILNNLGDPPVTITNKDVERIAQATAALVNRTLGDFTSSGEPLDGSENPELASKKIRRVDNRVQKIERMLSD